MNKAKLFLFTVVLLSTLSGLLAFKVNRFPYLFFYKTNLSPTAFCTIPTHLAYTTAGITTTTIPYTTTNTTTLCMASVAAAF
jgi:hypothetical protein